MSNDGNKPQTEQPNVVPGNRFPLTEKQIKFIQEARQAMRDMDSRINGMLSYVCAENDIKGQVKLSDDGTELLIEDMAQQQLPRS